MSKELPQPQQSEEVDLGQLFKLIGNAFDRFFKFIGSIFKAIFSVFIYAFKAIINNYKIIGLSMFISALIGFGLEKIQPDVYKSTMLVQPYFDSKYQLVTNINYYNALINERDYHQLKGIFEIDIEEANKIIKFKINPGPETKNDQILQFEEFIKGVDSIRAQDISFDEYVENRSIYSGDVFEIEVMSHKKNIFRSLEKGLNSTFTNTYSVKKMQKRDSLISINRTRILNSLTQVDSLKQVYINVMSEENTSQSKPSITTKDGILLQERKETKEYELLEKELLLREELGRLESEKVEEDVFFDTVSSFQDVGTKYVSLTKRYSLIFPILAFLILMFGFLIKKSIKYIINFEK